MGVEQTAENRSFGGWQRRYAHACEACACDMVFSVFLPPQAENKKVPVVYWLSGLTCTDENFVQKAGAQAHASRYGVAIVAPDTSPRGEGVADDPEAAYDFGLGAGFYLSATREPFSKHYHMDKYVSQELPAVIKENFPMIDTENAGIFGHSMGGHGALTIALKNPGQYKSVSAFAPIVAPSQVPWGHKAFSGYLGEDQQAWLAYDACHLVKQAEERLPVLIDQGDGDVFLKDQLKPHLFQEACQQHNHPLTLRMQPGYDHSYFFIASFMEDHIKHHAGFLT